MTEQERKVFVLALDGAPPDLVFRWADEGKLPTLQRIRTTGCSGELMSSIPWDSPSAWASFMTGMNPGKHGVFDFWAQQGDDIIITNASTCRSKTLWRYLSERGRTVGIVNVPYTYPAEQVNGFLISGIPCVPDEACFAFPPTLIRDLQSRGWDLTKTVFSSIPTSYKKLFDTLLHLAQARIDAALFLMERYPWDFFMIHFLETDAANHRFYHLMKDQPSEDPRYFDLLCHFYQRLDAMLKPLLSAIEDHSANLVVMSDHGAGPRRYCVDLNNWLMANGYMFMRREPVTKIKTLLRGNRAARRKHSKTASHFLSIARVHVVKKISFIGLEHLVTQVESQWAWRLPRWFLSAAMATRLSFRDIDWERTKAFSLGCGGVGTVYISLAGRQEYGVVQCEEYEGVRTAITTAVSELIDPNTGRKIVDRVVKGEEIYHGPFAREAPDLVIFFVDHEYEASRVGIFLSSDSRIVRPLPPSAFAGHRPLGLLMVRGQGIRTGATIMGASMIDIAPTILHLMGEPIPGNIDGRVLTECFEQAIIDSQITGGAEGDYEADSPSEELEHNVYTSAEQEYLLSQLRQLGYVD